MLKWLYGLIRPVCPHCDGKGGAVSGYYEPEWSGCRCCDPDEARIDEPVPVRVWRWHLWRYWLDQRRDERHWEKMYDAEMQRHLKQ
jgi:hypothetical protein